MVNTDGTINLAIFDYAEFTEFVLYRFTTKDTPYLSLRDMPLMLLLFSRLCASEAQAGSIKAGGKQPLRYHQYVELCKQSLKKFDDGFMHLFLTLTWNLMRQVKNRPGRDKTA
ncbi:hypothetical protein H310_01741 [Aphanomyces invadans]|uniref:Uncharacterized protein n=1 Tax=Aphanomyces invadans TaxID=157072 RepID=A0A024USD0_9STRA|nr:hypothetical protein H310_01741 [Aphanomyces invadans]ETW09386.1 hypothetical protein H310_01741 [Aphanomyces invadans]|eukprot:XP_008863191.1 hypothetical protein H310_01741 [Aphanomyces invadans]